MLPTHYPYSLPTTHRPTRRLQGDLQFHDIMNDENDIIIKGQLNLDIALLGCFKAVLCTFLPTTHYPPSNVPFYPLPTVLPVQGDLQFHIWLL